MSINTKKANKDSAGYMELQGAQKDADCEIVEVDGGISSKRGCCNLFWPKDEQVKVFSCGTCEFVETKPLGKREARKAGHARRRFPRPQGRSLSKKIPS